MNNIIRKNKIEELQVIEEKKSAKRISLLSTLFISILALVIFGYMTLDYFVLNKKIQKKIETINIKYDSLQTYLNDKLPTLDNAIKSQEQQLKDLQNLSNSYIIKK